MNVNMLNIDHEEKKICLMYVCMYISSSVAALKKISMLTMGTDLMFLYSGWENVRIEKQYDEIHMCKIEYVYWKMNML